MSGWEKSSRVNTRVAASITSTLGKVVALSLHRCISHDLRSIPGIELRIRFWVIQTLIYSKNQVCFLDSRFHSWLLAAHGFSWRLRSCFLLGLVVVVCGYGVRHSMVVLGVTDTNLTDEKQQPHFCASSDQCLRHST